MRAHADISATLVPPDRAAAVTAPVRDRATASGFALLYSYPTVRWDMVPARQQYLMEAMAAHVPVIFLNGPRLTGSWLEARRPYAETVSSNLTVVHEAFSFRFSRLGRKLPSAAAAAIDGFWLRRLLAERGVGQYAFWVGAPQPAVLRSMRPTHVIYDCIDPCFLPSVQAQFDRAEGVLLRRASVVFCTARLLLERVRRVNGHAYLLPNACSPDEYDPAAAGRLRRPEALAGRPGPIVGYMGTVDWRVDLASVHAAAKRLPTFTFVLIGRINDDRRADVNDLRALPNVIVAGPVSLAEGRAYTAAFDVGLIPFVPGAIADAVNPVKMYMYLAAGKPVVSTWCRECVGYEPLVRATQSVDEFVNAIALAAAEQTSGHVASRVKFARQNTWADRAAAAMKVLRQQGIVPPAAPDSSDRTVESEL